MTAPHAHLARAIAGQPTTWRPVPAGSGSAAVAAIERLAERLSHDPVARFGQGKPLVSAIYDAPYRNLITTCNSALTRPGASLVVVNWRWGVLWKVAGWGAMWETADWEAADWCEVGWHPGHTFCAIDCIYRDKLWDTLNPGKRGP